MAKRNSDPPADELLLAEALAAANARGLKHCIGARFRNAGWWRTSADEAVACCVLGALELAGKVAPGDAGDESKELSRAALGNDARHEWSSEANDRGESLGWAFRQAMTDE